MTIEETRKLLAIIQSTYPHFADGRDPHTTEQTWQYVLKDLPWAMVQTAVLRFIATDTKGYPPMPGNIRAMLETPDSQLNEDQAWALVVRAARRGLYNADEEFQRLPPEVQSVVGSPGVLHDWACVDSDEFNTVIGSTFKRSYRARAETAREWHRVPEHIRSALTEMGIGRIGDGQQLLN